MYVLRSDTPEYVDIANFSGNFPIYLIYALENKSLILFVITILYTLRSHVKFYESSSDTRNLSSIG